VALLVFTVACTQNDTSTADTAAGDTVASLALADLAGTWDGSSLDSAGNPLVRTELIATDSDTGWTLNLINAADTSKRTTTDVRVVSLAGDSLVVESGPYASVLREGQQITTRTVYRLENGRLVGITDVTYPGPEVVTLRGELTRR
jgi:hypothetical protein